ncbi:MAG: arsenate reductase ArsC [Gemmatimonadota bacterium]
MHPTVDVRVGPGGANAHLAARSAPLGIDVNLLQADDVEEGAVVIGDVTVRADDPTWALEAALLRAMAPKHVLFLCVANSARSQIGEGLGRALAPGDMMISSAGSEPSFVRPQAIQVLAEVGIDATTHTSNGVDDVPRPVDAVITLCAEEVCPVWLEDAHRLHWGLPDPAGASADPEEELNAFRAVRDELERRLRVLFQGRPV